MKQLFGLLALVGVLTGALVGCSPTSEPTEVPPTQTPWIVIVTATPEPESVAEAQPTQTPWIIVATPTRSKQPKPTPTKAATDSGPEATAESTATSLPSTATKPPIPSDTPAPGQIKFPPPVLLDPPSGGRVPWKSRVLLRWDSVGELAKDEYYSLQFDRPSRAEETTAYGDYVYVKDTEYLWEGSALAPFHAPEVQGEATVFWWVRVVRQTGEDENGKPVGVELSPSSGKWTLILEPKPDDA
ncbi:hypothetical protein ACFLYD_01980 [Chloroflexota bacterium]